MYVIEMDETQARTVAWALAVAAAVADEKMPHAAEWLVRQARSILDQVQADRMIEANRGHVVEGGVA